MTARTFERLGVANLLTDSAALYKLTATCKAPTDSHLTILAAAIKKNLGMNSEDALRLAIAILLDDREEFLTKVGGAENVATYDELLTSLRAALTDEDMEYIAVDAASLLSNIH